MANDDVIISLRGVGKKFCRSLTRTLIYGLRDVAGDVFGVCPPSNRLRADEFWALRDISFDVRRGECVGFIGPNGAGKSTLLKLLNGVILPDAGTVEVKGSVGALLELGAGFHPMLTGRENIRLSGAILGLSGGEIEERFASIVEFADLQEFIDTPVKYYSSGMYVRLGFAVAISTDPDVLIVDEALAVGDIAFRARCLERIDAFIKAGKTILFVTHNLQELDRVTRRTMLLDHGRIRADGSPAAVVADYLRLLDARPRAPRIDAANEQESPAIEIARVEIRGGDGQLDRYFETGDELQLHIHFKSREPVLNPVFRAQFFRNDGLFCHGTNTERHGVDLGSIDGQGVIIFRSSAIGLLSGDYSIRVAVLNSQFDERPIDQIVVSPAIHVKSRMKDGAGVFAMPGEWGPVTRL